MCLIVNEGQMLLQKNTWHTNFEPYIADLCRREKEVTRATVISITVRKHSGQREEIDGEDAS